MLAFPALSSAARGKKKIQGHRNCDMISMKSFQRRLRFPIGLLVPEMRRDFLLSFCHLITVGWKRLERS